MPRRRYPRTTETRVWQNTTDLTRFDAIVSFLDIEGVLHASVEADTIRSIDLEELRRSLVSRVEDATYLGMDKYDLGAVYSDFDSEAVERLWTLCLDFGASIVISSDWRRSKSVRELQALFRMHDLHDYVTDATNEIDGPPHYRADEVKEYQDSHPEIHRFVISDDGFRMEFDELFRAQSGAHRVPPGSRRRAPGPPADSVGCPGAAEAEVAGVWSSAGRVVRTIRVVRRVKRGRRAAAASILRRRPR